jgi:hypothetical protein
MFRLGQSCQPVRGDGIDPVQTFQGPAAKAHFGEPVKHGRDSLDILYGSERVDPKRLFRHEPEGGRFVIGENQHAPIIVRAAILVKQLGGDATPVASTPGALAQDIVLAAPQNRVPVRNRL